MPIFKYKSHLKPYWNPELTRLRRESKELMREGKVALYKNAKHVMKGKREGVKVILKKRKYRNLKRLGEISKRAPWYFVNKRKPKKQNENS